MSPAPHRRLAFAAAVGALLSLSASAAPPAPTTSSTAAVRKAPALTPAEKNAQSRLRAETIRAITVGLTDPKMEGRGTAQPGGEKAAAYLAERFKAIGLKPLGDSNGYLQKIAFRSTTISPASSVKVGDTSLKLRDDFVPMPVPFEMNPEANGNVVFVGYGVRSSELSRDDLAGIDIKGKVVVVLRGRPTGMDAAAWRKAAGEQALFQRIIGGGAAALVLTNAGNEAQPYAMLADYLTRPQTRPALPEDPAAAAAPPRQFKIPPLLLLSDAGAEKFFAGTGATYAELKAKAEAGEIVSRGLNRSAAIAVRSDKTQGTGSNVVGVLPGGDPKLKDEAVVISAHYDGWGVAPDGRVFPGAADNALGVGEMFAIAEALARSPNRPRRSVIFLAVTGEEHGLLGAEHWVQHPTWPLNKVVADLNFDGIGSETWGPVKTVAGYGEEFSELGQLFRDAAAVHQVRVVPDPVPDEHVWERSDHFAFVQKGIPALMPLGGQADMAATVTRARQYLKDTYHQPDDVVRPDWNWDGARTVASVLMLTAQRVANGDARPSWLPAGAKYARRGTPQAEPKK
jgi:Zn-dependent M28 family amino/carboxypeptidase